jgi:hypothetical protein
LAKCLSAKCPATNSDARIQTQAVNGAANQSLGTRLRRGSAGLTFPGPGAKLF